MLAYAYISTGDLDLALSSIETALSISYTAQYIDTRGDVYRAIGNTELMCQDYTTACDLA